MPNFSTKMAIFETCKIPIDLWRYTAKENHF
jgi:hypothetical protein